MSIQMYRLVCFKKPLLELEEESRVYREVFYKYRPIADRVDLKIGSLVDGLERVGKLKEQRMWRRMRRLLEAGGAAVFVHWS